MKLQPERIYAAVLGAMGAAMGAIIGGGVGETWGELLLGLFIIVLAVFVWFDQIPLIPIPRIREFLAGAIIGFAAEYFAPSPVLIAFAGAAAGAIGVPAVQSSMDRLRGFLSRHSASVRSIALVFFGTAFAALFLWAHSRGIFTDVLLVSLCVTVPILLVIIGRDR